MVPLYEVYNIHCGGGGGGEVRRTTVAVDDSDSRNSVRHNKRSY